MSLRLYIYTKTEFSYHCLMWEIKRRGVIRRRHTDQELGAWFRKQRGGLILCCVLTRCSPSNLKNGVFIDVYQAKIRFEESA